MTDPRPIGVFDSGVGGLTVLRAVRDVLPGESTIYVGDLAFFPYGPRDQAEVRARALAITGYLANRDVKALVVACNTATSAALPDVEAAFSGPVVGVVRPGADEAVRQSRLGSIGVVATAGTVRSHAYAKAISDRCPECSTSELACGELVGLIESGRAHEVETKSTIQAAVTELIDRRACDTIILGCTHFPLVRDEFERAAAGRAAIVDSAGATVSRLRGVLDEPESHVPAGTSACHEFLVTAHAEGFVRQARNLFGEDIRALVVDIEAAMPAATAATG